MNCHHRKAHANPENGWDGALDPVREKPPAEDQRDLTAVPEEACDPVMKEDRCLFIEGFQSVDLQIYLKRK